MLNQFTGEYKQIMLDAENLAKKMWDKEILPEDMIVQITAKASWNIADLFEEFGINISVIQDVFSRPPFALDLAKRKWDYAGISSRLKELIVISMRVASGFQKSQAGIEDFLLAFFQSPSERWFSEMLDFIGIIPKDFEKQLIDINTLIAGGEKNTEKQPMFWPMEEIMDMLEDAFGGNGAMPQTPFSANKPQDKKESNTPWLDFFGVDLVAESREKTNEPIIGRDTEIDRLISILNRKTKNNPCLVGDPWVGKTAVVEGLAKRIASGDVPFAMQNKRVIALDLSGMIAGTKYRGEFEQRIKMVIDEASKLENEVILFIDEIHTIIGTGSGEGGLDAANILKPAMARGKICLIGATTLDEYQKYIEKDSALERRFQKIDVEEPTPETAKEIIKGLKKSFEEFHNLIITDEAIEDAVDLSVRYITDRFLPDKAIDLLDEACSTKSMTYHFDSSEIEWLKEKQQKIQKEMEDMLIAQQYQKALVKRKQIDKISKDMEQKKRKKRIPRKDRMKITDLDIHRVIHQSTGIPLKNLAKEDTGKLKWLEKALKKSIFWQNEAIASIVSSIKRSHVGISDTNRPIGSFLFLGPTGVGKTELVKVLAKEFYADPKALIKIDMSEFQDKSSASKLIGTTAGYVGYEEGGMLTEKVRRKPYSIILFDEIEKGNFDVYNLLLQILEDGVISDGKGRQVNFKNTIIIMTSNIGSDEFNTTASRIGFDISDNEEQEVLEDFASAKEKITSELTDYFSPEFLNRIDKTIVFNPLDKSVIRKVAVFHLDRLADRLKKIGITFEYDVKAVNMIVSETYNPEYGARPVRRYIQDSIEDAIADSMIVHPSKKQVSISAKKKELVFDWK